MDVREYQVRRFRDSKLGRAILCLTHVERRKVIGWRFAAKDSAAHPDDTCWDCDKANEPSVLDTVIEADDAAKAAAEPKPAPVLKGQRRLF